MRSIYRDRSANKQSAASSNFTTLQNMLGRKPGSGSGSEPLLAGGGSSNRVQVPTALASPPYSSDSVSQSRTARARSNYSQRSLCLPPFYPTGISCRPRHVCPLAPLLLNTSCKKDHDHLFAITHFLSSSPCLSSTVPCSYIVDAGASLQAFVQASCCQLRPLSHKCNLLGDQPLFSLLV